MKVSLFKNFSSVIRDRFKKSVGGLPLGDGFDHETERSGLLVTGAAGLGRAG